jgi:hypothetical protein
VQALLAGVALALLGWFFFFAFVRRLMGMNHLLLSFAVIGGAISFPLMRYAIVGRAALDPRSNYMDLAVLTHFQFMVIATIVSVSGLAIFVAIRPDDLLRWTPTGAAWSWYRRSSLARVSAAVERASREVKTYRLSHDIADGPVAERFRKEMRALGAIEPRAALEAETSIVLLTSRTRSEWLAQQERGLPSNALLVVGSPIGLLDRFEHLWRREWMDFRQWDSRKIAAKQAAPPVPEAVTRFRYPSDARLTHQILCFVAGLAFVTAYAINPSIKDSGQTNGDLPPSEWLAFGVTLFMFVLAQRFLNRTISARAFARGWRIALAAAALLTAWALGATVARHDSPWALSLGFILLVAAPSLLLRLERGLAFWFPPPGMAMAGKEERLKPGRNWQTLLWVSLWLVFWLLLTQGSSF